MLLSENRAKILVQVHPNAAKDAVVGFADEVLQVRISAPPAKSKANKKLVAFLSQILDIRRNKVSIVKGHKSRNKVIAFDGLTYQEVVNRPLHSQSVKPASSAGAKE